MSSLRQVNQLTSDLQLCSFCVRNPTGAFCLCNATTLIVLMHGHLHTQPGAIRIRQPSPGDGTQGLAS